MLLTHRSPPRNKGEKQSRGSTCKDIYFLPLPRYQPSSEKPRSSLFDLMKRREGKQRARAYGREDKLLKLGEEQVQASSNYKAKIKTQATSTAFFIFAIDFIQYMERIPARAMDISRDDMQLSSGFRTTAAAGPPSAAVEKFYRPNEVILSKPKN
ncbi:hypothetical protein Tco_1195683 [Tanacetum coccineum]